MARIVAEVGVNHNGSEETAVELIHAACEAGADVIKFQTFRADSLVTVHARQAEYQAVNMGRRESQLEMLRALELSHDAHRRLLSLCRELGIEFLSAAFDSESLRFLVDELELDTLKVPSGELTNAPLILEYARSGCDLIISTGMADVSEIQDALAVVAFGCIASADAEPDTDSLRLAFASEDGQGCLQERVMLLHCTTDYPVSMADVNLRAMDTIAERFRLRVGYSDHSDGIVVPIAAVARGAALIEKHFTLDKGMPGPDHKASLDPAEFALMVSSIRATAVALGNGDKAPCPVEIDNRSVVRKSLVAATSIQAGEVFSAANIAVKRPGDGLSPYKYWELLGRSATRDYEAGDLLVE